eukprot:gene29805-35986_t
MDDQDEGYAREEGDTREQDRFLPVANIARIMKTALPPNAKIAKDAKEAIQECVSEFISFITSEASDRCLQEKRKTINGDDLLWAMTTLGFDRYVEPLKTYLAKYREAVKGDRPEKKVGPGKKAGEPDSPPFNFKPEGISGVGAAPGVGSGANPSYSNRPPYPPSFQSIGTSDSMLPGGIKRELPGAPSAGQDASKRFKS